MMEFLIFYAIATGAGCAWLVYPRDLPMSGEERAEMIYQAVKRQRERDRKHTA